MATNVVAKMEKWKQLAFVACVAQRLSKNYDSFWSETSFGDPEAIHFLLSQIWAKLELVDLWPEADRHAATCQDLAPDTEGFSSAFTSAALDAVTVLCICLQGFIESVVNWEEASQLAIDSIEIYAQDLELSTIKEALLREERGYQGNSVEILLGESSRVDILRQLRALASSASSLENNGSRNS